MDEVERLELIRERSELLPQCPGSRLGASQRLMEEQAKAGTGYVKQDRTNTALEKGQSQSGQKIEQLRTLGLGRVQGSG